MTTTLRSRNRVGLQHELQTYQIHPYGEESDIPPSNTQYINCLGENYSTAEIISNNKFRDELDQEDNLKNIETSNLSLENPIKQKLLDDCINPEALPSGDERVRSIQQVMAVFTTQLVLTSLYTIWLLKFKSGESMYVRLAAFTALFSTTLAFHKYSVRLHPVIVLLCFGVFSVALPYSVTLATCLMDNVVLSFLLIQLCTSSLGMCLYAWTTKYENWSGKEELSFMVIPQIFACLVMIFILGANPFWVIMTGVLSLFVGIIIADCSKDNIVPAKSLDQLLSDAMAIHFNIATRSLFLFKIKIMRLARKSNWF